MSSTDNNELKAGQLPSRHFIRDRSKRKLAFAVARRNKEVYPDWNWHVGISFNTHVAIDLESDNWFNAIQLAHEFAKLLRDDIGVFKTDKGFWLVNKATLTHSEFLAGYEFALKYAERGVGYIDKIHVELSLKYDKTTLRVSPKKGTDTPKLITVIINEN